MKRIFTLGILLAVCALGVFAEQPPIASGGWNWENGVNLNGKTFYDVDKAYKEQDGWAYIEGHGKLHYWLYDSYSYLNGDVSLLMDKCIPTWIESMGYTIDFDHIKTYSPNNVLASSVKNLMKQRWCDVSVSLVTSNPYDPYVVVNNYDANKDYYWTAIYPLITDEMLQPKKPQRNTSDDRRIVPVRPPEADMYHAGRGGPRKIGGR